MENIINTQALTRGLQHALAATKASGRTKGRLLFDGTVFAQEAGDDVLYGYRHENVLGPPPWNISLPLVDGLQQVVNDLTRTPLRNAPVVVFRAEGHLVRVTHGGLSFSWQLRTLQTGPFLRPETSHAARTFLPQSLFGDVYKLLNKRPKSAGGTPAKVLFDPVAYGVWVDNGAGSFLQRLPSRGPKVRPVLLPYHLVLWLGRSGFGPPVWAETLDGRVVISRSVEGGGWVFATFTPRVDLAEAECISQVFERGLTADWPAGLKLSGSQKDWVRTPNYYRHEYVWLHFESPNGPRG